jgi:hypothetical protein
MAVQPDLSSFMILKMVQITVAEGKATFLFSTAMFVSGLLTLAIAKSCY